jgi:hypothetical protein
MLAERGVTVSHTTIYRWVQQYVPEFEIFATRLVLTRNRSQSQRFAHNIAPIARDALKLPKMELHVPFYGIAE